MFHGPVAPPKSTFENPSGRTFCSSAQIFDGTLRNLLTVSYPSAKTVGVVVSAPYIAQPPSVRTLGFILDDSIPDPFELWILGKAQVGIGGTSYTFNFDIPLGQTVQLVCEAETLEISARLFLPLGAKNINAGASSNAFTRANFIEPPTFRKTTALGGDGAPQKIVVQAIGGPCTAGLSNATRRARAYVANGGTFVFPAPDFATAWKVLGDTSLRATANSTTGALRQGPYPIDAPDRPVSTQQIDVTVANGGGAILGAETVWRLGFSGFPS